MARTGVFCRNTRSGEAVACSCRFGLFRFFNAERLRRRQIRLDSGTTTCASVEFANNLLSDKRSTASKHKHRLAPRWLRQVLHGDSTYGRLVFPVHLHDWSLSGEMSADARDVSILEFICKERRRPPWRSCIVRGDLITCQQHFAGGYLPKKPHPSGIITERRTALQGDSN